MNRAIAERAIHEDHAAHHEEPPEQLSTSQEMEREHGVEEHQQDPAFAPHSGSVQPICRSAKSSQSFSEDLRFDPVWHDFWAPRSQTGGMERASCLGMRLFSSLVYVAGWMMRALRWMGLCLFYGCYASHGFVEGEACTAVPVCVEGTTQVERCVGTTPCYEESLCGTTIACAEDRCELTMFCGEDETEVPFCDEESTCSVHVNCGRTHYCQSNLCNGLPTCEPRERAVPSCEGEGVSCRSVSVCGTVMSAQAASPASANTRARAPRTRSARSGRRAARPSTAPKGQSVSRRPPVSMRRRR